MHTGKCRSSLDVGPKELFLKELDLHVPYSAIKEVTTVNEDHIDVRGMLPYGIFGAIATIKETYLRIVYNDGILDQNLILKTGLLAELQKRIYQHIVETKQSKKP